MRVVKKQRKSVWLRELDDLVRGASGGFLFGIPLLYTMEVWWIGSHVKPLILIAALVITFSIVFLLNRTAGFRKRQHVHFLEAAINTVEAMAIGISCAALTLWLLQELTLETSLLEAVGKIVFEGTAFTLGVSLANQFLGDTRDQEEGTSGRNAKPENPDQINATFADIGATLIGAIVIAFNIAPTDEIPMLAASIKPSGLLLIIAASLLISYGIVFEAGFSDQRKRRQQQGIFQRPLSETIMSYLVSLLAAAAMLWFFQRLTLTDPWTLWLEHSILLGLPATIGGAAGRLAI